MEQRNIAQQIREHLGIAFVSKYDIDNKRNPSYTKKGPGRFHKQGKSVNQSSSKE